MMKRHLATTEVCSTCQYWNGIRTWEIQKSNGHQFILADSHDKAKCMCYESKRYGKEQKQSTVKCPKYVLWDEIV